MDMKRKTKAQLVEIAAQGGAAGAELRRREVAAAHEKNMAWLGKRFKARNSFSCPQDESDYWWTYYKVTNVEGESIYAMRFDRDKYGHVRIETEVPFGAFHDPVSCSDAEFNDAWESCLGSIVEALGE